MPSSAGILARSAPSATAEWKPLGVSNDGARIWAITGDDGSSQFAVREPIILRSQESGAPLFSLTLTLERQPAPGEATIVPLIRSGAIAVTLDVLPAAAELARIAGAGSAEPLFPRAVGFAITRGEGGPSVVEAMADGSSGRAGISGALEQDDAIATLRALRGESSGLFAAAKITYRASGPAAPPMRVELDLAAVHDFLAAATGPDGVLLEIDLLNYLAAMIEQGALKVTPVSASASDTARVLLPDFIRACMPILSRTNAGDGSGPAYRLQGSPSSGSMMMFQSGTFASGALGNFTVSRPLEAVLAPITRERPLESFLSVVTQSPDGRGYAPLSQRQRGEPTPSSDSTPMAGLGNTAAAMPAVLRTGRAVPVNAHVLAASDLVIAPARPQRLWLLNDLVVDLAGRQQHYPQIDGPGPIWPDRISPDRWWYAPELVLVQPQATSTAASTPFLFSFTPTGHDEQGRPGLEATIRLRLRAQMPAATQQLWESRGKPAIDAVPLNGISASLEIPYRNAQGQPGSQVIAATSLEGSGEEYEATFELTDQWARLAYGALAIQGFQAQAPNLVVSYVFPAYVPVDGDMHPVLWGGKRLEVAAPIQNRGFTINALAANRINALHANSAVLNATAAQVATTIFVPQRSYGVRTQGHTDRVDCMLPCSKFGMLYVQTPQGGGQPTAIGCQDAFTLGQVQLKLYEALVISLEGGTPPFRVYRSLQVPGRFLVLPNEYTIARFEPGDSRAYRPALFMFSNIDAVNRDRTRCVVMATLQPSVSAYWRTRLLDYLRANVHPSPQLEWPTELAVQPVYSWALPSGGPQAGTIDPAVAKTPDGFQVSLATGVDGILQLKAMLEKGGVSGVASFALADGSVLQAALTVDLAKIDGPFVAGPVEVTVAAESAHLVNRIEQPVDVGELVATSSSGLLRVPVEQRLAPGAAADVAVPAGTPGVDVQATTVGGVASLEEVRTFVEDIYVTPVFQASFDFAAQKLASVTVEARIAGTAGSTTGSLTPTQNRAEMSLILPLTTYLAQPTLQFALTRTPTDGPQLTGAWHDWRLDTLGTVIEINSTLIQQG